MIEIVMTKLIPPHKVNREVKRKRLLDNMDKPDSRITVIKGGAGYGKTSLANKYIKERNCPTIWYQLDEGDKNPYVFFKYLNEGLKSYKNIDIKLWDFLAVFINKLSRLESVCIVLDDYHEVDSCEEINTFLKSFIKYIPQKTKLIITTERELPFVTASFRAKGILTEITGGDLSFTLREANSYFNDLNLPENEIKKIWDDTEGWPAGIALARYAFYTQDSKSSAVFKKYSEEYLREELISKVNKEEIRIYEKFSILDELNPEACNYLTNTTDSKEKIEFLYNNNLYINTIKRGSEYRLNKLFKNYLQSQLINTLGEEGVKKLHSKAAEYFIKNGEKEKTVNHLLKGEDFIKLKTLLIDEIIPQCIIKRNYYKIINLIEQLPSKILNFSPELLLFFAEAKAIGFNHTKEAMDLAEKAIKLFQDNQDKSEYLNIARANLLISIILNEKGKGEESIEAGKKALDYIKKIDEKGKNENKGLSGQIYASISQAALLEERWEDSTKWAEKAEEELAIVKNEDIKARFMVRDYQFFIYHPQQDLYQALRALKAARKMWDSMGIYQEALITDLNVSMVYRILGQYKNAEDLVRKTIGSLEEKNLTKSLIYGKLALGQILRDKGEEKDALDCFNDVIFEAKSLDLKQLQAAAHHSISGLYRNKGNIDAAFRHGENALKLAKELGIQYFVGQALMNMGRLLEIINEEEKCEKYFRKAVEIFKNWKAQYEFARVNFYLAGFLIKKHTRLKDREKNNYIESNFNEVENFIKEGLRIVRTYDYHFFFKREKQWILPILRWGYFHQVESEYLKKLINELGEGKTLYEYTIQTLGTFRIYLHGKLIGEEGWYKSKAASLLRYLIINRNKRIEKETIFEAFWPDKDPRKASNSFSSCIYDLRKAILPNNRQDEVRELIKMEKGFIWIDNGDNLYLDIDEFINEADKGFKLLEEGDDKKALEALKKAVSYYKGDLLEGFPFEDWIVTEREKLRGIWLKAQWSMVKLYESSNSLDEAITILKEMIAREPYRERIYGKLIELQIKNRQRTEAINYYNRLKKMMIEEFQEEPDIEITNLLRSVINAFVDK